MIDQIHTAIQQLLTADAPYLADLQALQLGARDESVVPKLLLGLRTVKQVQSHDYPAQLLDVGDGEAESLANSGSEFSVIGFEQQGMAADVLLGFIWSQQERDRAVAQRLGLQNAVIDLFLRNPDPGGATLAWVRGVAHDRSALHPTQTTLFTIRVEYAQQRTPR